MESALVSARVPKAKKEAAAAILASLGATASELVNNAYDFLLAEGRLPGRQLSNLSNKRLSRSSCNRARLPSIGAMTLQTATTSGSLLIKGRRVMNLLLDTCVVIDYLGRKEPFYAEAERVMAAGFFGDARLWIAGQTINDAFYVLSKYLGPRRVQAALEALLQVVTPVALSPTIIQTRCVLVGTISRIVSWRYARRAPALIILSRGTPRGSPVRSCR